MRALMVERPGVYKVQDVPEPTIGPRDALIRVEAAGICGTDLHILAGEFPPTPYPIIPGHEFAGVVEDVGDDVVDIRRGDRVAVDPSLFCGTCRMCRAGRGNLCERWAAIGDTVDGAFAELVRVPAGNVYGLPDRMDFPEAALIEPVSCAVHGLDRLGPTSGDTGLILGAGTMGILLARLLRIAGVDPVVLCDINAERRAWAARNGFGTTVERVDDALASYPTGFDVVIEASGAPEALEDSIDAVARGGKLLVFGVAAGDARASVAPFRLYNDELTIIGSMAVLASFGRALDLVSSGRLDAPSIVTARFPLEAFGDALAAVRSGTQLKVQIAPNARS